MWSYDTRASLIFGDCVTPGLLRTESVGYSALLEYQPVQSEQMVVRTIILIATVGNEISVVRTSNPELQELVIW